MNSTHELALNDLGDLAPSLTLDPMIGVLRQAHAVQIAGHVRPDGDCIGSMLAMHYLLEHWNIPHAMAAPMLGVSGYDELPGYERITQTANPELTPDLAVFLDCATRDRGPEGVPDGLKILNIDHHGTNTRYGTQNWIEPRASSVGELMFYFVRRAGVALDARIANALLLAIMTDTGSFRFPNTGARQHLIAAHLVAAGADAGHIACLAYGSMPLSAAQLMGHVFQTITLVGDGRVGWSEIRRETYQRYGDEDILPENLSNCLRQVRGVEVALLFHELRDGGIRVNFRSAGHADVAALAAEWGGGGHAAAAGMTLPEGDYVALRDEVLKRAVERFGKT